MKLVLSKEEAFDENEVKFVVKQLNKIVLKPQTLLSILFFAIGIGFFCLSFAFDKDTTIMGCGIFIVVFALIYLLMIKFLGDKAVKKVTSSITYNYKFYDDRVVVCSNTNTSNGNVTYKYADFKKCVKQEHYTFLFINKNQAYIIRNQDLNEEFFKLLKTNIKKYKE